jgi:c-di-GMP-binding flagellar brake protein YcgR
MEKQEFLSFLDKSIGCKIEIINKSGINKGMYPSSLLDLKDGIIGIAQPMYRGTWVQMSGMQLILNIKSNDTLLEVPVISRGTSFEGLLPILWVEQAGDISKVQRRSFVRIPCFIEASCCFLEIYSDVIEPELNVKKEWFSIFVNDISLGGIAAKAKAGFQVDFYEKGRYLLAIDLGKGLMFLNLLMRNIFANSDDNILSGAFAFGGLTAFQERVIGNFVRRQELAGKK